MTLVLSAVSGSIVWQASDRRITLRPGGQVWDPAANKSLIYLATDAAVAIGHAGPAFIGDLPTDQWLAEQIFGESMMIGPSGGVAMRFGRAPRVTDLGSTVRLLRESLESTFRSNDTLWGQDMEVLTAGWQWPRRRGITRPVAWRISETSDQRFELTMLLSRHWWMTKRFAVLATPRDSYLSVADQRDLASRLAEAATVGGGEVAGVLVEAIRKVADPGVGEDLMAIAIPRHPSIGPIRVQFVPSEPHQALFTAAGKSNQVDVAFSPWVLTPGGLYPPSVMGGSGEQRVQAGSHEVVFHMPPLASAAPGIGFSSGQRRRKRPR